MSYDIRNFFGRGSSASSKSIAKTFAKTPEKQVNGTSVVVNEKTDSTDSGIGSGDGSKKRKAKPGPVILSDESDAEDPIPQKWAKKANGSESRQRQSTPPPPSSPKQSKPSPTKKSKPESTKKPIKKSSNNTRAHAVELKQNGGEQKMNGHAGEAKPVKEVRVSKKLPVVLDLAPAKPVAAETLKRPSAPAKQSKPAPAKKSKPEPTKKVSNPAVVDLDEGERKTVSYLGVAKPAKEIPVGNKLLAALDQAHAQMVPTPSVYESPKTIKTPEITSSPSSRTRSATKLRSESIPVIDVIEKTPDKAKKRVVKNLSKEPSVVSTQKSPAKTAKKTPIKRPNRSPVKTPAPRVEPAAASNANLPWVEKYRPTSTKQVLGQQGDKSCMKKLSAWLRDWSKCHITGEKQKKHGKGAGDDGSIFKAALLSGPPGIGKTTTAQVVCKELGLNFLELNASDARNKKRLEQSVSECLSSHSMTEYNGSGLTKGHGVKGSVKNVLIMDEVDGMSGNEDRAGVAELIALIKKTRVPIICICNDRQSQKIRTLSNYCYDLRFHRPQVPAIRSAVMSVLFKEHMKLAAPVIDQIIEGAGHDIRQVLNHLNFLAASGKSLDADGANSASKGARKDENVNVFEAVRKLFSASEENQQMTMIDRTQLFFSDYDLIPLFVEENYVNVTPAKSKNTIDHLDILSRSADLLSVGDTIDRQIRTGQNWSLLTQKAMFSTVLPCELMKGRMHGQITFPSFFGRLSKHNRLRRLMQQLQMHTSCVASASSTVWAMEYAPAMRLRTTRPLCGDTAATDGVKNVLKTLDAYSLTLEDRNAILEITQWPGDPDPMSDVTSKVKAALTRAYNKHEHKLPYATAETAAGSKKRQGKKAPGGEESASAEIEDDGDAETEDVVIGNEIDDFL